MADIDLGILTDIVRELEKGIEDYPVEEVIKNGKTFVC